MLPRELIPIHRASRDTLWRPRLARHQPIWRKQSWLARACLPWSASLQSQQSRTLLHWRGGSCHPAVKVGIAWTKKTARCTWNGSLKQKGHYEYYFFSWGFTANLLPMFFLSCTNFSQFWNSSQPRSSSSDWASSWAHVPTLAGYDLCYWFLDRQPCRPSIHVYCILYTIYVIDQIDSITMQVLLNRKAQWSLLVRPFQDRINAHHLVFAPLRSIPLGTLAWAVQPKRRKVEWFTSSQYS